MPMSRTGTMPARKQIEALCVTMAAHVDRAETTVIRWASGSGDTIQRIRDGRPMTDQRADKIIAWFATNWPEDLEWPAGIPTPKSKETTS